MILEKTIGHMWRASSDTLMSMLVRMSTAVEWGSGGSESSRDRGLGRMVSRWVEERK